MMFKLFVMLFAALLGIASAVPGPVAKPNPNPAPSPAPQYYYGTAYPYAGGYYAAPYVGYPYYG